MKKTILLNGQIVEYSLNRKNVKNLNVRVKPSGEVTVSANNRISELQVETFLEKNAIFILRAIEKFKASNQFKFNYNNGDKLFFLGKEFTLYVIEGENFATWQEDKIVLSVKDKSNLQLKQKGLDSFYRHYSQKLLNEFVNGVFLEFKKHYQVEYPKVLLKKLKSVWGNCRKDKKEIHISIYLSKLSLNCAKYVLVHEFAHLIEANHSSRFYNVVKRVMPEYKILQKQLKQIK